MKLKRIVLNTALLLATFGLGWHFGTSQLSEVHAQKPVAIPKDWGAVKATGMNGTSYVFEAPDGTLRVVTIESGQLIHTAARPK